MPAANSKKIVVIGDGGFGKTSLARRLLCMEFDSKYIATVGCEVYPLHNSQIKLWDTAGQEKFGGLRNGYFINSDAAIVVYSLACAASAYRVPYWINYYHETCPGKPVIVVATSDDEVHQVEAEPEHSVVSNKNGFGIADVEQRVRALFSHNMEAADC